MATINLTVEDHSIRVDNLIELAQGSNNFDTCAFSFDGVWDGFTLYAVMFQNPKNVFKRPLDRTNTCKIPGEVLQKDGWVYIGARGEKEDTDETIVTSMVVKLPVRKGAVNGNKTGQEMLDQSQYEYLLGKVNELNEKCESLTKELQTNVDKLLATIGNIKQNGTGGGSGLTTAVKNALLNAFSHVAWTDENGQSYYDALATALNSSGSDSGDNGDEGSGDDDGGTTVVTLTSISATYSGGEVASGTALSDLTGIVVTGNYSDGTTKTITNYELSGEIASGTNTITVSYGGLTTTFKVVGTASTRTYLEFDAKSFYNTYTGVIYSDDGETTKSYNPVNGYVINQTFEEDIDVHFKITWGATTVWRNLALVSVVPESFNPDNGYVSTSTMYRWTNLADYYVEGQGTSYCYSGNVYEGVYNLKAGCVFALIGMNGVNDGQTDAENTHFYVEG